MRSHFFFRKGEKRRQSLRSGEYIQRILKEKGQVKWVGYIFPIPLVNQKMKIITETKRLIIREIGSTDVDVMLELHADPEVHIYLGNKTITSREKMMEAIDSLKQQYIDFGVGRWAMISKKTNEFIGWTGLEFVTKDINHHNNFYDLGYRLLKRFWRQGYATESAFASLEYGFNQLKATEIYAMADVDNDGSNKILKKVGLKFIETFDLEGVQHNWYTLERSAYTKKKRTAKK